MQILQVKEEGNPKNERLLWDIETQTATVNGLFYGYLCDRDGKISKEEKKEKKDIWSYPSSFRHITCFRGIHHLKVSFIVVDKDDVHGRTDVQHYYLKSYTLRQMAVAMGGHKRLGNNSPLMKMDWEILDMILKLMVIQDA